MTTSGLLAAGLTVGDRYTVISPLSRGAMGEVYRARDETEGRQVALKRLIDTRHAARFEAEARLVALLRHPRVVRVTDHFQTPEGHFLVMDLVEGTDLHDLLAVHGRPGLPIDDVLSYISQACDALGYVHDQQIVHRDVKPQNMILGDDGVVLVDFGIARSAVDQTITGTIGIGTPRYMAPEVFDGGNVSPRSDVYGLAATMWTLLTGDPPRYAEPRPVTDLVPDASPELAEALALALEVLPERRLASVDALASALGAQRERSTGHSLVVSIEGDGEEPTVIEAIVRTAAGVFDAAASSIAIIHDLTDELVYHAAWGAGAREIVGVRLPVGQGIAGSVARSGLAEAVPDCRKDPRFEAAIAKGTGYVPHTLVAVPLQRRGATVGVLSLLDRRDGGAYTSKDVERAGLFAELAVTALRAEADAATIVGTQLN